MEYRKNIELDTSTEYWFVELGELNRLNGSSSWPFPDLKSAQTFALAHKQNALVLHGVHRDVHIRFPDGSIEKV